MHTSKIVCLSLSLLIFLSHCLSVPAYLSDNLLPCLTSSLSLSLPVYLYLCRPVFRYLPLSLACLTLLQVSPAAVGASTHAELLNMKLC